MSTETSVAAPAAIVPFNQKPKPKVYIAASAYDWKCEAQFASCLNRAAAACHSQLIVDWGMGDAAIGRKRNFQAWRFLTQTDCDFLFYIDSDIIFDPVHIDRLVSHNLPIVGGIYPKKCARLEGCYNAQQPIEVDDRHLFDAKHAGNGFLCIHRSALERIIGHFKGRGDFEYRGDPDPELRWDLFPFYAKNWAYKSEDWAFCEMAKAAGIQVKIDESVQVQHIGKIIFPLSVTLSHEDIIDLIHHKCDAPIELIRAWMKTLPKPPPEK